MYQDWNSSGLDVPRMVLKPLIMKCWISLLQIGDFFRKWKESEKVRREWEENERVREWESSSYSSDCTGWRGDHFVLEQIDEERVNLWMKMCERWENERERVAGEKDEKERKREEMEVRESLSWWNRGMDRIQFGLGSLLVHWYFRRVRGENWTR